MRAVKIRFHSLVHIINFPRHLNFVPFQFRRVGKVERRRDDEVVVKWQALLVDLLFDLTLVSMNPYPCRKDREHNP